LLILQSGDVSRNGQTTTQRNCTGWNMMGLFTKIVAFNSMPNGGAWSFVHSHFPTRFRKKFWTLKYFPPCTTLSNRTPIPYLTIYSPLSLTSPHPSNSSHLYRKFSTLLIELTNSNILQTCILLTLFLGKKIAWIEISSIQTGVIRGQQYHHILPDHALKFNSVHG